MLSFFTQNLCLAFSEPVIVHKSLFAGCGECVLFLIMLSDVFLFFLITFKQILVILFAIRFSTATLECNFRLTVLSQFKLKLFVSYVNLLLTHHVHSYF